MKTCINCGNNIKDKDKYCRNCGCLIQSNVNYIFINIVNIVLIIGVILLIVLFVASYFTM